MAYTLLQIDPSAIIDTASKVQPGDNSGYTFAIIVLSVMLVLSLYAVKSLYDKNTLLQTAAVTRTEAATKALVEALNAVKEQYRELHRSQEAMNEILKEIKSKLA